MNLLSLFMNVACEIVNKYDFNLSALEHVTDDFEEIQFAMEKRYNAGEIVMIHLNMESRPDDSVDVNLYIEKDTKGYAVVYKYNTNMSLFTDIDVLDYIANGLCELRLCEETK